MSTTWTTRARAAALRNLNWDLNVDFKVSTWDSINVIEGALHEIAHAVVLGLDRDKKFGTMLPNLSGVVTDMLATDEYPVWPQRGGWQEVMALAAEVLVLRKLNLRVWNLVVWRAAMREAKHVDAAGSARTFADIVRRATHWKTTQRRAARALQILDYCCEMGLHA